MTLIIDSKKRYIYPADLCFLMCVIIRIIIPTPNPILHPTTTSRSIIRHRINPTRPSSVANGLTPDVHVRLELYMGRTWTLVAIVLAGIGACGALWMLIYVLIKICDSTLSGQQTLGLLMLVGVILMYLRYVSSSNGTIIIK